jgi:hypothetical protein
MRTLAEHVDRMRATYPDDELAIVRTGSPA